MEIQLHKFYRTEMPVKLDSRDSKEMPNTNSINPELAKPSTVTVYSHKQKNGGGGKLLYTYDMYKLETLKNYSW